MKYIIIIILIAFAGLSFAADANDVNKTIEKLNQSAANLKTLTAEIEYTHTQTLFDTQTVRTGKLFYLKDEKSAFLRINFESLKQDQAKEQKYREEYVFDGQKLTRIDYQSKSVVTEQYAKDANTIEPFELVQDYFPIIGLAKPQEMTQDFDITLNGDTLKLIPKENSRFHKTYTQVNVTINPELNLPVVFNASTTDNEEITIKLNKMETSKPVKKEVFELKIPTDFTQTEKPISVD
jgi:outer membrane lipoprotein-sorting protein